MSEGVRNPDPLALAERLFDAIPRGDADTLDACYAPELVVWHNYTGVEQSRDDHLKMMAWLARAVEGYRYTIVERRAFNGGFVQRHIFHGRFKGHEVNAAGCIVGEIVDSKIVRLSEYMDSAAIAPLLGK